MVSFSIGTREGNAVPARAAAGRLVIASNDLAFEAKVRAAFEGSGDVELHWWRDPEPGSHVSQAIAEIASGGTAAVALGPDHARGVVLELARALNAVHPEIGVVIVRKPSRRLLHAALLVGARDVIATDANENELRDGLGRVLDMVDRQRAAFDSAAAGLASTEVAHESDTDETADADVDDFEDVRPELELVAGGADADDDDDASDQESDDWGLTSWAALPSDVEDLQSLAFGGAVTYDDADELDSSTDAETLEAVEETALEAEAIVEAESIAESIAESESAIDADPVASSFASWATLPATSHTDWFEHAAPAETVAPFAEAGATDLAPIEADLVGVEPLADESYVIEPVGLGFGSWVAQLTEASQPVEAVVGLEDVVEFEDAFEVEDAFEEVGGDALSTLAEEEQAAQPAAAVFTTGESVRPYEPLAVSWAAGPEASQQNSQEKEVETATLADDAPADDQDAEPGYEWIEPASADESAADGLLQHPFASAWMIGRAGLDETSDNTDETGDATAAWEAPAALDEAEEQAEPEPVLSFQSSTWAELAALDEPVETESETETETDAAPEFEPVLSFESSTWAELAALDEPVETESETETETDAAPEFEPVLSFESSTWAELAALDEPVETETETETDAAPEFEPVSSFESSTWAELAALDEPVETESETETDAAPEFEPVSSFGAETTEPELEPVSYLESPTPFADYQALYASAIQDVAPATVDAPVAESWTDALVEGQPIEQPPASSVGLAAHGLFGEAATEPAWTDLGELRDESTESPGYVVSVVSPKGGVGRTTVATNLAIGLAEVAPGQVVIVDLDLQFGDVADALRLLPERTFDDTRYSNAAHDPVALKAELTPHPLNLFALCAPATLRSADELKPEHVQRVLELLAKSFRYVIVDTPAGLNEHTIRAIELSTDLVLLSATDVPSVRATRRAIEALRGISDPTQRCHFVLNRADARTGLHAGAIEQVVGMHIDVAIPSSGAVPLALNQGTPILEADPRSPVSLAMSELVSRFGSGTAASSKGGGSFWRKKQARR